MAMTPFTPSETDIVHRTRVDLILRPVQNTIHIVQYDDQLPVVEDYTERIHICAQIGRAPYLSGEHIFLACCFFP